MKKISVLVPCYNEEAALPSFYEELTRVVGDWEKEYDWELLFVDDGSKDATPHILQQFAKNDERVVCVELSRNFGKESAMLAGFDYVTGDCVIIADADLQHPPSVIPEMIKFWREGYEDVYARRTERGTESWLRKKLSLLFYKLLQRTTKFDILQNVGDFRLLDRCCIEALKTLRESERYTKGLYCWIGFKKKEINFKTGNRIAGKSNWGFFSLANLAVNGIVSFTTAPLRWSTFVGFFIALCAFCFMAYYIVKTLVFGEPVQGFPTLLTAILFLGGIQLFAIGILGEYVGKIFNESKNRPVYIVRKVTGKYAGGK